jgi:hypothetical protein
MGVLVMCIYGAGGILMCAAKERVQKRSFTKSFHLLNFAWLEK